MLLQILPVWHTQNPISVMINYMFVMVRDLLYLIPHIISYILQNESLPCLIYYMFHKLNKKKDYSLFNNFVMKILSLLNFTLLFSMSRISSLRKFFFSVRVKMASMPFQSLLPHLYRKLCCLLACPLSPIFGIVNSVTQVHVFWIF